jgi:hypothetical protein
MIYDGHKKPSAPREGATANNLAGNGFIFSRFPTTSKKRQGTREGMKRWIVFRTLPLESINDSAGIPAKLNYPKAEATEADVVVRVTRRIVQVQRLNSIVAAIIPIAATYEADPLIGTSSPSLNIPCENAFNSKIFSAIRHTSFPILPILHSPLRNAWYSLRLHDSVRDPREIGALGFRPIQDIALSFLLFPHAPGLR